MPKRHLPGVGQTGDGQTSSPSKRPRTVSESGFEQPIPFDLNLLLRPPEDNEINYVVGFGAVGEYAAILKALAGDSVKVSELAEKPAESTEQNPMYMNQGAASAMQPGRATNSGAHYKDFHTMISLMLKNFRSLHLFSKIVRYTVEIDVYITFLENFIRNKIHDSLSSLSSLMAASHKTNLEKLKTNLAKIDSDSTLSYEDYSGLIEKLSTQDDSGNLLIAYKMLAQVKAGETVFSELDINQETVKDLHSMAYRKIKAEHEKINQQVIARLEKTTQQDASKRNLYGVIPRRQQPPRQGGESERTKATIEATLAIGKWLFAVISGDPGACECNEKAKNAFDRFVTSEMSVTEEIEMSDTEEIEMSDTEEANALMAAAEKTSGSISSSSSSTSSDNSKKGPDSKKRSRDETDSDSDSDSDTDNTPNRKRAKTSNPSSSSSSSTSSDSSKKGPDSKKRSRDETNSSSKKPRHDKAGKRALLNEATADYYNNMWTQLQQRIESQPPYSQFKLDLLNSHFPEVKGETVQRVGENIGPLSEWFRKLSPAEVTNLIAQGELSSGFEHVYSTFAERQIIPQEQHKLLAKLIQIFERSGRINIGFGEKVVDVSPETFDDKPGRVKVTVEKPGPGGEKTTLETDRNVKSVIFAAYFNNLTAFLKPELAPTSSSSSSSSSSGSLQTQDDTQKAEVSARMKILITVRDENAQQPFTSVMSVYGVTGAMQTPEVTSKGHGCAITAVEFTNFAQASHVSGSGKTSQMDFDLCDVYRAEFEKVLESGANFASKVSGKRKEDMDEFKTLLRQAVANSLGLRSRSVAVKDGLKGTDWAIKLRRILKCLYNIDNQLLNEILIPDSESAESNQGVPMELDDEAEQQNQYVAHMEDAFHKYIDSILETLLDFAKCNILNNASQRYPRFGRYWEIQTGEVPKPDGVTIGHRAGVVVQNKSPNISETNPQAGFNQRAASGAKLLTGSIVGATGLKAATAPHTAEQALAIVANCNAINEQLMTKVKNYLEAYTNVLKKRDVEFVCFNIGDGVETEKVPLDEYIEYCTRRFFVPTINHQLRTNKTLVKARTEGTKLFPRNIDLLFRALQKTVSTDMKIAKQRFNYVSNNRASPATHQAAPKHFIQRLQTVSTGHSGKAISFTPTALIGTDKGPLSVY